MQKTSILDRQLMGCGFLPPLDGPRRQFVKPWTGPGYKGPEPTVCPGYTTNLPEVQEIARARFHWTKNALAVWLNGQEVSPDLLTGIEIVDEQVIKFESWKLDEASKNRGGK